MIKPCTWEGVEYPSIKAASDATGINYTMLKKWIRYGRPDYSNNHKVPCIWNGIHYSSIKEAADANYITPVGMWFRIRKNGYSSDADMKKIKRRDT